MKGFLKNITDTLADAALLEMGVGTYASSNEPLISDIKRFFRNFSITMADAALLELGVFPEESERQDERDIAHPDDCQYGDNDLCFV